MKSLLDLLDKCATFVLGLMVFGVARRWLSTTPPEGLDLGGRIGWHLGDVMGAADHFFDGVPVLLSLWFLLAWAAAHAVYFIITRLVVRLPGATERAAREAGAATRRMSQAYRSGRDESPRG